MEQFNLLEIMLSGRAVMGVIKELYPPEAPPPRTKRTIVIAALEGDVHDLGKNIVKAVLTARRYRVVDCGKDCSVETIIDTAERETAFATISWRQHRSHTGEAFPTGPDNMTGMIRSSPLKVCPIM